MTDRQQDQNRQSQQQQNAAGQQGQQQQGQQGMGQQNARQDQLGQQGGQSDRSRQQQQFDASGSGDNRFADQIREHQEVVDAQGNHVGTVDHVQGDQLKLSRKDSSDGQHHYVPLSQVQGIEGDKIRLRERGDNDFGQEGSGAH